MENYNGSEEGGVSGFEFTPDGIILQFKDGRGYLYNYIEPGKEHVEQMKKAAIRGSGLTTYVNKYVRGNYYRKL